jgi:hypothetical protein
MRFGDALLALERGKCVARSGWNGRGMYVFYVPGRESAWIPQPGSSSLAQSPALPYLAMKTVDGSHVPWLISQTDALATDWVVVPVEPSPLSIASDATPTTVVHTLAPPNV